jgi:hypothetical protein
MYLANFCSILLFFLYISSVVMHIFMSYKNTYHEHIRLHIKIKSKFKFVPA